MFYPESFSGNPERESVFSLFFSYFLVFFYKFPPLNILYSCASANEIPPPGSEKISQKIIDLTSGRNLVSQPPEGNFNIKEIKKKGR